MKSQSASEPYKVRVTAAFFTLLIGLVILTPVCGLLFQCHCDWPWLTFYHDCNYFNSEVQASHKCPWCNSNLAALGSIGTAFILATLASLFLTGNQRAMTATTIAVKVGLGLSVFMVAASLTAALAAHSQHYPLGIGGLYSEKGPDYSQ